MLEHKKSPVPAPKDSSRSWQQPWQKDGATFYACSTLPSQRRCPIRKLSAFGAVVYCKSSEFSDGIPPCGTKVDAAGA